MGYFEEHKKRNEDFKKWQDDLEERLANHLFYGADGFRRPDSFDEKQQSKEEKAPLAIIEPKKRVEVLEDQLHTGTWMVFLNGQEVCSFIGPFAHRKALRMAASIANDPTI